MSINKQNSRKWLLLFFVLIANLSVFAQSFTVSISFSSNCSSSSFYSDTVIWCQVGGMMIGGCINGNPSGEVSLTWHSSDPNIGPIYASSPGGTSMLSGNEGYDATLIVIATDELGNTATDTLVIQKPNGSINLPDTLTLCQGDSVLLLATGNFNAYSWRIDNPNQSPPYSYSNSVFYVGDGQQHKIYLRACGNSVPPLDSIVIVGFPLSVRDICLVTVDTATNHNRVIWEKTQGENIAGYYILKLNDITSQYDSIGFVHKDSLTEFIDVNSNPAQQSSSYKLRVVNASLCEYISNSHTTIHLSANQGTGGQVNLSWNAYDGFSYNTFEIYRSNNGGAYQQIGNTANNVYSYTDLTPPSGTNYYYVAIAKVPACDPSRSISSTISNILNPNDVTGVNNIENFKFSVYPNPFADKLNVEPNVPYKLFDLVGREVYDSESKANLSQLSMGTYIFQSGNTYVKVLKK